MSRKIIQDDNELFLLTQMELRKLQRQCRIMESDKRSYATELKCYLQKQRNILETLTNEREIIQRKFSEIDSTMNPKLHRSKLEKQFSELLRTNEKQSRQIRIKKKSIREMDNKIKKLENESERIKNNNGCKTSVINKDIRNYSKTFQSLKNKLYIGKVKYDVILTENSELKKQIDAFLRERMRFIDAYRKLTFKFKSGHKYLFLLVEQATIACEYRNEADEKLKISMNEEQQETIILKHKMRELYRQLDHFINLKKFVSIKSQKRILIDFEEKESKKRIEKETETEEYFKKYKYNLEELKKFCNEISTEKLASIFVKQEEENFALFNYVNEINNEVDILQEEIKMLQNNLDKQKKENETTIKEKNISFHSLNSILEMRRKDLTIVDNNFSNGTKYINTLLREIKNILLLVKCEKLSFISLLGKEQLQTRNINLILDIVEKIVHELINEHNNI